MRKKTICAAAGFDGLPQQPLIFGGDELTNFETLGLEVHVELITNSKFSLQPLPHFGERQQ